MKILLDIKDHKAIHFLEMIKGLTYIKTKTFNPESAKLIENLKEAAEQVRMHKLGKLKLKTAQELLNEL